MNDTPSPNEVADALEQDASEFTPNEAGLELAERLRQTATLLRHLDAENRRLQEEVEALKAKADNCWGAANYRLKYLAMVGHKLGLEYDDQGDTRYASKLCDLAESFRTRLADAERECDDHKKIKEAEKLILIEEVAKNAKLETALRTAEAELANLSNPNWCYNNLAAHHTFTRDKMVSAERRIGEPLMEDIRLLNEDIENKKAALHAAESSLKVAGSELALYEWLINDGGRVVKMNDGSGYDYYGRGRALESVKGAPTPIACIKAARLAEK